MSFVDQVLGIRFGKLVVKEIVKGDNRRMLKCLCDCGNEKVVDPRMLKRGDTTSCGCFHKEQLSKRTSADLIGQRFGRLQVEDRGPIILVGSKNKTNTGWKCKCDCGNTVNLTSNALLSGNTKSCGCYNRDQVSAARQSEASYSTLFHRWNKRAVDRGIAWTLTLEQTIELFTSNCHYCGAEPEPGRSSSLENNGIDRKYSDKGYTIDNVVACCKQCNFAKHTLDYDSFIKLVKTISNKFKKAI